MSDLSEVADAFEDPKISEIWMDVTDLLGDATMAKEVIRFLSVQLWNLEWQSWERLAKQSAG